MTKSNFHSNVKDGRSPRSRSLAVLAAVLVVAGTLAAGATADAPIPVPTVPSQLQDPGSLGQGTPVSTDSNYTPVPKDGANAFGWKMIAGDVFPGADREARELGYTPPSASTLPNTVDFYTVSFLNDRNGVAAGAACASTVSNAMDLSNCPRVPVIWRYSQPDRNLPGAWSEVYRGSQATGDGHGFVGAIAWVPAVSQGAQAFRAVAVGGNGCYPRRDLYVNPDGSLWSPSASPGASLAPAYGANDLTSIGCAGNGPPAAENAGDPIAGAALAWQLLPDGNWQRISDLPATMRGLTALAFSPRPSDCGAISECGFAGGYRQMWMWTDGRFVSTPTVNWNPPRPPESGNPAGPSCLTTIPPHNLQDLGANVSCEPSTNDWPFRVRAIRFEPSSGGALAVAVTSGCCYVNPITAEPDPSANWPRIMFWQAGSWRPQLTGTGTSGFYPHGQSAVLPDSFYGAAITAGGGSLSIVASPGGAVPPDGLEASSQILGNYSRGGGVQALVPTNNDSEGDLGELTFEVANPDLSTIRLLAADGDSAPQPQPWPYATANIPPPAGPDGWVDWAVGELRATAQAVAYTTLISSEALGGSIPSPFNCPGHEGLGGGLTQCQATTPSPVSQYVFTLPSYALNAFVMVPQSGTGWAVGDRGAILSVGAQAESPGQAASGKPAPVGPAEQGTLPSDAPYEPFRGLLSAGPGLVPPLSSQPLALLPTSQLIPAGSPDPHGDPAHPQSIEDIVMSRDGSEGWAIGPNSDGGDSAATTLYHFDGAGWARCDAVGIPGVLAADPACASLAQLVSVGGSGVKIRALARIPVENDGDPSSDEFELVAFASFPSNVNHAPMFLIYKNGQWSVEREWSDSLQALAAQLGSVNNAELAFGSSNDGWLLTHNPGSALYELRRNSGSAASWVECFDSGAVTNDCSGPLPGGDDEANSQNPSYPTSGFHLAVAGSRVYLYGTRASSSGVGVEYPVILHEDGRTGRRWVQDLDPKDGVGASSDLQGSLNALSVAKGADGSYTGWAVGVFSPGGTGAVDVGGQADIPALASGGVTPLLRSTDGTSWNPVAGDAVTSEYLLPRENVLPHSRVVAFPGLHGSGGAVAILATQTAAPDEPMVRFDPAARKWDLLPAPFESTWGLADHGQQANVDAVAPDNQGGAWLAVTPVTGGGEWFYHETDHANRAVFSDVPNPVRGVITATATGGDGSFWVATASSTVYRYDRVTGWDTVTVPGWDPGHVTAPSPAYAIAVGPNGRGVVVGKQGRIADIDPHGATLDVASEVCVKSPSVCGSGNTLRAAAVAPDGSELIGGDNRTVLWRPAGGTFVEAAPPNAAAGAQITGIAMPTATSAWLTTDTGDVFVGSLSGSSWKWTLEDLDPNGSVLARDSSENAIALHAVAVDAVGHGFAVGDHGLILERTPGVAQPWQRLVADYGENLFSVALGPGGRGAIIGGDAGLVLTLVDGSFVPARASDYFDPITAPSDGTGLGGVVGVGLVPGYRDGQVEAWAAEQLPASVGNRSPAPGAILHYSSDPSDPLLDAGVKRARPLPDAPAHVSNEIDFAAFGNSACHTNQSLELCPEFTGSNLVNEVIARDVRDQLLEHQPAFAVFTGDVSDAAGTRERRTLYGPTDASLIHERWSEQIAQPLIAAGIPLYGAVGVGDLANIEACDLSHSIICESTATLRTGLGLNTSWRQAMAQMPSPWGAVGNPPATSSNGFSFAPVNDPEVGVEGPSVSTPSETVTSVTTPSVSALGEGVPSESTPGQLASYGASADGAHTHYAFDVVRDGSPVLRVVVVDTSLKTLTPSAADQNPIESQLRWLSDVLFSRPSSERAVVVSETPAYTYGPGFGTDTLTDAPAFETLMQQDHVTAVISGRLGWNGLYYTSTQAAGLHCPQAGGAYPDPSTGCSPTAPGGTGSAEQQATGAAGQVLATVAGAINGLGAPAPGPTNAQLGAYPTVISASAGGPSGPADQASTGSASQGYWHGYSLVRLLPSGAVMVEERPVFDWIGISGISHDIQPGQHLSLDGYGREPVGIDQPIQYDAVDSPAITHRYDLVEADPGAPYLPKADAAGNYIPVDPSVATIDRESGRIQAESGHHPRVYALAILSVGKQAATYPVVFEPANSFASPKTILPTMPAIAPPAPLPPAHVGALAATAPALPTSPPPVPPEVGSPMLPQLPTLSPPPPAAAITPPTPPLPPAPPTPPNQPTSSPLTLNARLSPIGIQATVVPPSPPPVNPAPPSGSAARKEAKQRQAATAKSEEGSDDQGVNPQDAQAPVNPVSNLNQSATTRRSPRRPLDFTAVRAHPQPSAWTRDLLYGSGLSIAAFVLALGFSIVRPIPRRREPRLPAPARAWSRR